MVKAVAGIPANAIDKSIKLQGDLVSQGFWDDTCTHAALAVYFHDERALIKFVTYRGIWSTIEDGN